jgi:hypothetical protein
VLAGDHHRAPPPPTTGTKRPKQTAPRVSSGLIAISYRITASSSPSVGRKMVSLAVSPREIGQLIELRAAVFCRSDGDTGSCRARNTDEVLRARTAHERHDADLNVEFLQCIFSLWRPVPGNWNT